MRIDLAIKEGLHLVLKQEHRSLTNMIEVMARECCQQHNVIVPEQQNLFND